MIVCCLSFLLFIHWCVSLCFCFSFCCLFYVVLICCWIVVSVVFVFRFCFHVINLIMPPPHVFFQVCCFMVPRARSIVRFISYSHLWFAFVFSCVLHGFMCFVSILFLFCFIVARSVLHGFVCPHLFHFSVWSSVFYFVFVSCVHCLLLVSILFYFLLFVSCICPPYVFSICFHLCRMCGSFVHVLFLGCFMCWCFHLFVVRVVCVSSYFVFVFCYLFHFIVMFPFSIFKNISLTLYRLVLFTLFGFHGLMLIFIFVFICVICVPSFVFVLILFPWYHMLLMCFTLFFVLFCVSFLFSCFVSNMCFLLLFMSCLHFIIAFTVLFFYCLSCLAFLFVCFLSLFLMRFHCFWFSRKEVEKTMNANTDTIKTKREQQKQNWKQLTKTQIQQQMNTLSNTQMDTSTNTCNIINNNGETNNRKCENRTGT